MNYEYTTYILALLASTAVPSVLAVYVWRHYTIPATNSFAVSMLMGAAWSLTTVLELMSPDLSTKLFWSNIKHFSYIGLPLMTLVTVLQYTGRDQWLTLRRFLLLTIIPLTTMALLWTNDLHGLMRKSENLAISNSFPILVEAYGPWFSVQAGFAGILMLVSVFILATAIMNAPKAYRGQPIIVLIGFFTPSLVRILYILGFSPVRGVDITPFTLSVVGIVLAWGLFRFRLLDIIPVARDVVIEGMSDGLIVIDSRGLVVDFNPAAGRIFGHQPEKLLGLHANDLFKEWPHLTEICQEASAIEGEFEIIINNSTRYFEVHVSPLLDRLRQPTGQVIVFHDISDRKRQEEKLVYMATHDLLTGLPNRRTLEEALQRVVARALRGTESALLFVDLDNFKQVNDTLGHSIGDEALVSVANALLMQLRTEDLLIRLGGDEFAVLLEGADRDKAESVAARLKEAIENLEFTQEKVTFQLSLSIGLAMIDGMYTPSMLLSQADTAMYEAKAQGRNRVVVFHHPTKEIVLVNQGR